MAYWQSKPKQSHKTGVNTIPLALDGGLNKDGTIFNIAPNEAWDCKNTSNKIKGALSLNSKPKEIGTFQPLVKDVGIGKNRYIHTVHSNGLWQMKEITNLDGVTLPATFHFATLTIKSDAPTTGGKFIDFQVGDEYYTILATTSGVWAFKYSSGTVIELVDAPKTDMYAVDDYRLYALKGNTLYASDTNSMTDWNVSVPLTGAKSNGTAIVAYDDKVYCFTDRTMHVLYGDDENNYTLSEPLEFGCANRNSLTAYRGSLYFFNNNGLFKYNSGEGIVELSKKIKPIIDNRISLYALTLVASRIYIFDNKLYLKLGYTFILDLDIMTWSYVNNISNYLFVINGQNNGDIFMQIRSSNSIESYFDLINNTVYDTTTEWYHVTPMRFAGFNKHTVTRIPVLFDLPNYSTMKVQINTNVNMPTWVDLHTFTPSLNTQYSEVQNQLIHIPMNLLNNVDYYQLKFSGTGDFIIYYIGDDGRVITR